MYTWNDGSTLQHHGILGQKWGVRRYQNPDGSLTAEGEARYGKKVQKAYKKAKADAYKQHKKNGGGYLFPSARQSTGKNYDKAVKEFDETLANDKRYKELSKKAFDAEKKRLLAEKPYALDEDKYDRYIKSKEYLDLVEASRKATKAKEARVAELEAKYIDRIKDAKLDDMKITEYRDIAKKYVDGFFQQQYWDENLEFNVDNFYEDWVDKEKFH